MSGEGAGKVEERDEKPFVSFRHVYNLCMVSVRFHRSCEYKTQSERYFGVNIQTQISQLQIVGAKVLSDQNVLFILLLAYLIV